MLENRKIRIGLIIPIYNVEKTICKVLSSVASALDSAVFEILIIDNASGDETILKVQSYLQSNSEIAECVSLIQHKSNYGYGCSIKLGFEYFGSKAVSHVMIIHGDHQVDPAWLIKKLIGVVKLNPETDLVLASRFMPESNIENYSVLRKFGNYFFNVVTTFCSGYRMSDSGTAMIILRKEILCNVPFLNLSNSWQFHPQFNILICGLPGIRIKEISMNWADSESDSTVPLLRYGLILLKMLFLFWFRREVMNKLPKDAFPVDPVPYGREYVILNKGLEKQNVIRIGASE